MNYNNIDLSRKYYRNLIKLNIVIGITTIIILGLCVFFEIQTINTKIFTTSQNGRVQPVRILGFN